jgi:VIT1/CCC1 family predicted Fe2+/Mn2+ transporter
MHFRLSNILAKCQLYQTKFSFGATSAIITNLGLITGLRTTEHAKLSIIGSILIVALADNISDSLGIHVFQESEGLRMKEIWAATFGNFLTRIILSLIFILLIALFPLKMAVFCSIVLGLLLLAVLSYVIAKNKQTNPYWEAVEHLAIACIVMVASNFLGRWLINKFKF